MSIETRSSSNDKHVGGTGHGHILHSKYLTIGLFLLALTIFSLSACGQKGDLYLPDPNAKAYPEEQREQLKREKQ